MNRDPLSWFLLGMIGGILFLIMMQLSVIITLLRGMAA